MKPELPHMRRPLRILSMDGGGIRGAATAEFLRCLEMATGKKVTDLFDYFAGTSAGGLLALSMGGLGQTAEEASALFSHAYASRIMDKSILDRVMPMWSQIKPKYDGIGKREVLTEVLGDRRISESVKPTLVTAYSLAGRRLATFKSHGGKDARLNPLMVDIAEATSAAPLYFPAVRMNDTGHYFIDGGIAANNPAMCAMAEALKMGYTQYDIQLVSIGTGEKAPLTEEQALEFGRKAVHLSPVGWLTNGITDHLIDGSASAVTYWCDQILGPDRYIRVQGALDEASSALDDCSPENIEALKKMGRQWYEKMGAAVACRVMAPPLSEKGLLTGASPLFWEPG